MFYVPGRSAQPCFLQGYNVTFVKRPGCDIDVVREAELNLKRENQGTRIQKQIETSATCKSEGCVPPRARAHFGRLRLVQQRKGGSREHSQHFPRPHQVNVFHVHVQNSQQGMSAQELILQFPFSAARHFPKVHNEYVKL